MAGGLLVPALLPAARLPPLTVVWPLNFATLFGEESYLIQGLTEGQVDSGKGGSACIYCGSPSRFQACQGFCQCRKYGQNANMQQQMAITCSCEASWSCCTLDCVKRDCVQAQHASHGAAQHTVGHTVSPDFLGSP